MNKDFKDYVHNAISNYNWLYHGCRGISDLSQDKLKEISCLYDADREECKRQIWDLMCDTFI